MSQSYMAAKSLPTGSSRPIIEIEDHTVGVTPVIIFVREIVAESSLHRDEAQAQGTDVGAAGKCGFAEHLGPGEHGVAGETRTTMNSSIDRHQALRILQAVESQRASYRDHVTAIDQATTKLLCGRRELIDVQF